MKLATCTVRRDFDKKDPKTYIPAAYKWVTANLGSTDLYLDKIPEAKTFVDQARKAWFGESGESNWAYNAKAEARDILNQFPGSRHDVTAILDGKTTPSLKQKPFIDKLQKTIQNVTGKPGNLSNQLKLYSSNSDYSNRIDHFFDKNGELEEKNFDRIFVRLVDAAGREKFREPVYKDIQKFLHSESSPTNKLLKKPDISNLSALDKATLDYFSKSYAGYPTTDHSINQIWKPLERFVAKQATRAYVGFNSQIQILHGAKSLSFSYPRLGEEHFVKGFIKALTEPTKSYDRAVKAGLIDNTPIRYKSNMEKLDSLSMLFDIGNKFDKVISHEGFLSKFPGDSHKAAVETAKATLLSNPTSPKGVVREHAGALMLFKDFIARAGQNITEDTMKALLEKENRAGNLAVLVRYLGVGVALQQATSKLGVKLSHFQPLSLIEPEGPIIRDSSNLIKWLKDPMKEDRNGIKALDKAALLLTQYATPGGKQIIKRDSYGEVHIKPPFSLPEK